MSDKIYTAFISSAFKSLRDERNLVIDSLLDYRILPIGMEHFTVSTSGEFSDIEELIDESDFFIMLLGDTYGSCDREGISWTEREFLYAQQKNKPTVVMLCDELQALGELPRESLSEDQKKQLDFSRRIGFARPITKEFGIGKILSQYFSPYSFSKCRGWVRAAECDSRSEEELARWREEHRVFDLGGNWYHVHLSDSDESYIRIGTVKIEQDFTPESFLKLHMDGKNYNVSYYDSQKKEMKENMMKSSRFVGDYTMQENGEIFGIFNAVRSFQGSFNSVDVTKGTHRGIHDFVIDVFEPQTLRIDGEFHDEAPSPKQGRLFLFRDVNARNEFILENRADAVEQR